MKIAVRIPNVAHNGLVGDVCMCRAGTKYSRIESAWKLRHNIGCE